MDFYQDPPELRNTFRFDSRLQEYLRKCVPPEVFKSIESHLDHVGQQASTTWMDWATQAEAETPVHIPYDAYGHRIDQIRMSSGWKNLEAAAATEGVVAAAYERKQHIWSRVYQSALLYLFHPSSAFVSCPLAMTDGAARAIELYGDEALKNGAFKHLTSRDPKTFWTSGQWMTEKSGGSDVSGTETVATKSAVMPGGFDWTLTGVKWFTSATTSPMAMLLARPEGAEAGNRGLSLYYTELRDAEGALKNIEILRLKDKLGTRALPTAELRLQGAPARLVGGEGHGVRKIASLFNVTRVYNSICATAHFRRALDLAQSYSDKRSAFGHKLRDLPLHRLTLTQLEREFAKCFMLTFFVAELLGKDEMGHATEREKSLLRALTPVVKLYTARQCMLGTSEVVEMFAGVGYCEDSGLPRLLRDAQVFSIWEGTTNVLSLDFLRALEKEQAGPALQEFVAKELQPYLRGAAAASAQLVQDILKNAKDPLALQLEARRLSFAVAETIAGGLLAKRGVAGDLF